MRKEPRDSQGKEVQAAGGTRARTPGVWPESSRKEPAGVSEGGRSTGEKLFLLHPNQDS